MSLTLFLCASPAWAVTLPSVQVTKVVGLGEDQRQQLLSSVALVLEDAELNPAKAMGTLNCSRAGWVFSSVGCSLNVLHKGCSKKQVRCAPWTGSKRCVPDTITSLKSCLDTRTANEKKQALNFFTVDTKNNLWVSIWASVQTQCLVNENKNCTDLKMLVTALPK